MKERAAVIDFRKLSFPRRLLLLPKNCSVSENYSSLYYQPIFSVLERILSIISDSKTHPHPFFFILPVLTNSLRFRSRAPPLFVAPIYRSLYRSPRSHSSGIPISVPRTLDRPLYVHGPRNSIYIHHTIYSKHQGTPRRFLRSIEVRCTRAPIPIYSCFIIRLMAPPDPFYILREAIDRK